MKSKLLITTECIWPGSEAERMIKVAGLQSLQISPIEATEETLLRLVPDIDAHIAAVERISARVIEAACKLKIICLTAVGYDSVDLQAATRKGIPVVNIPGANHHSAADLVLGLMLDLARNIAFSDRAMRAGKWERKIGRELGGGILGIVGLGRVGKEVALRAKAFRMEVIAHDTLPDKEWAAQNGVSFVPFHELLQRSDFVSINCPKSDETRHMINRNTITLMKENAFLINVGRGAFVNEPDLLEALREKRIAGAGLDVFEQEPTYSSPFAGFDNVILTPHLGGHTHQAIERMGRRAVQNVLDALAGKRPDGVVNPEVYLARGHSA